jgi:sugar phosphate isomerase/epimerase
VSTPHDIGISTGAYADFSLSAALLRIAELAPAVEVVSLGRHSLLEPVNFRAVELSGLALTVHGPYAHADIGHRSERRHRSAMDLHRRHLAAAAELGATIYVVHPDLRRRTVHWDPKVVSILEAAFEEFLGLQEETGVSIVVENMPWSKFSHFTAPGDLDLRGLGLALDVGHATLTRTLDLWLAHPDTTVRHLHLHDNLGEGHLGGDTHLSLGDGIIDPALAIGKAREAGASIVLEHGSEASVISSLSYLQAHGLLFPPALSGEIDP